MAFLTGNTPVSGMTALLPQWIDEEVAYAYKKYGSNNPLYSALSDGLHEGGVAYMDYFNYLGKLHVFSQETADPIIALKASQAALKFLNVSTAHVCVQVEKRLGLIDMMQAYESEVRPWLAEALPQVQPVEPIPAYRYARQILHTDLEAIAMQVDAGQKEAAEAVSRQLLLNHAAVTLGWIARLKCCAAPGYPSGDVVAWQVAAPIVAVL